MPIEMFIKIGTIEGDSVDESHAGEIEVLAYALGFSNSGQAGMYGGGHGSGKVNAQDLSLTVRHSKASLALFAAVATGEHFPSAILTLRRAGERPIDFLQIRLENVMISSDSMSGSSGDDQLIENYSLNYSKIVFTYTGQDAMGSPLPPIETGFDFAAYTKI